MAMARIALISPKEYVDLLHSLPVPGYTGYPGGIVAITSYMSANPQFGGGKGGNAKAGKLNGLLQSLTKGKPENYITKQPEYQRVFTGQGLPMDLAIVMSLVNANRDALAKNADFKAYFKETDFLQAMADDGVFGIDCIGFVGNYMVQSGLEPKYVGRRPLDFASLFKPVKSLDQVRPNSVVMLTNGLHIQMIDQVRPKDGQLLIDLCQSSKGGPQMNVSVTLSQPHSGGSYLPVDEFRKANAGKTYQSEWEADNRARAASGEKARDYESFLRAKMTAKGRQFGYLGGAIFQLSSSGNPNNPVGGSVYVGVVEGGISIRTP
jgi:hypothetical protein